MCATLATLKAHSAPGSVILADIYATRVLNMFKGKVLSGLLAVTHEGMHLGLDFSSDYEGVLRAFFAAQGLILGRHRFVGAGHRKGPFMVVAELLC